MTMQLAAGITRDGTRVPTLRQVLGCGMRGETFITPFPLWLRQEAVRHGDV